MASGNDAICNRLKTLDPGTPVSQVFIQGTSEMVAKFVNFDERTNLVYFTNGTSILEVNCKRIDAIRYT
jgi:hypothetical protein